MELSINPIICSLGALSIRWYGVAYVIGFILAKIFLQALMQNYIKREEQKTLTVFFNNFDIIILLSILIGGRVGYFIFYKAEYKTVEIFKIYQGGMSFHGAVFMLFISTIIYSRLKKISCMRTLDLISTAAPIGIFLGRIANFINQELYGKAVKSSVPWAIIFKFIDNVPRHPSQIYEAILEGIILLIILLICAQYYKSFNILGMQTCIFTFFYCIFRIIIEYFRDNQPTVLLFSTQFTVGQILCIIPLFISVLSAIYFHKKAFLYKK